MAHSDLEITAELIQSLLRDQHPDLADLPIELGALGWDNQLWRLGDNLAVRLPWATDSADGLLLKEHTWLPTLAPHPPLPIPVPQRLGQPSERFPRPWIVTTWVPGDPADRAPVTSADAPATRDTTSRPLAAHSNATRDQRAHDPATHGTDAAEALATFLTALHQPAPAGAPTSRDRGGPLSAHTAGFAGQLATAADLGLINDPAAVQAAWDEAAAAPDWTGPPLWVHGDLHPANVLTRSGTFCGVIDFGDLHAGDPALDLAAPWILLPESAATRFHETYKPTADPATLRRARGWALSRAITGILIGDAGDHGRPGGKPTWGPPAHASLQRLLATAGS